MVMPNTYPALALAPQTASYIASDSPLRAYYMGREERLDDERRNYLREAGGLASQGNISGAVGAAFRGGDPTTAINISNWDTSRRTQALTTLLEGARRADTPERWAALVGSVERVFGPDMVQNYRDFNSRPGAMTALEQAQLQLTQAQTAAQQQHGLLYGAQTAAAGRQADTQRMFLNLLQPPSPSAATAAPPPLPPPAAAGPPVAAPPMAAPSPAAPTAPGSAALTPGAAPSLPAPPSPQPPQPQTAPAAPAPAAPSALQPAPAPATPTQPQSRRTVADIFGSASPTEQAEVLALINQNKLDDAMKRLREIGTGGPVPDAVRTRAIATDQAYQNITTALDGYRRLVEGTGMVVLPGQERDAVVQARRNIQLQLKELFNLGVLNGPDLELMDQMLPDPAVSIGGSGPLGALPSGLGNVVGAPFGAGAAERVGPAVKRLQEILRGIRNSQATTIGLPPIPPPQGSQPQPQSQQGTQPQRQSTQPEGSRRALNGVNYILRNGQWFQE